ncbi:hypothetical protein [Vallitalea guaymasensis]|uniref:Uncharacterized protein n=1 Tax=Vallitalea guaymasensis TaxID=1185412 RepID=A0A8J8MBE7_9FIRM|nr:hypothetical protein [Vallitalea guaymasensis]QUH29615.1 hypothetical protein HYG85_12145 [Vallitalea guaymasensis]
MKYIKKTKMLNLFALVLIIVMAIPYVSYAQTSNIKSEKEIKDKKDLVKQAKLNFENLKVSNNNLLEEGNKLLLELYSEGYSEKYIAEEAKKYGIYVLISEEEPEMSMRSTETNADVSKPLISYNATDDTWTVTGGGYWTSEYAFYNDTELKWDTGKRTGAIGKLDVGGISITNIHGNTEGVMIEDAYLCSGDQYKLNDNNKIRNIKTVNDTKGVAISFQDAYYDFTGEDIYQGYRWAIQAKFTSEFANISCNIKSYFLHTYKSANIGKFHFHSDGTFDVDMENAEYSWDKYSQSKSH